MKARGIIECNNMSMGIRFTHWYVVTGSDNSSYFKYEGHLISGLLPHIIERCTAILVSPQQIKFLSIEECLTHPKEGVRFAAMKYLVNKEEIDNKTLQITSSIDI